MTYTLEQLAERLHACEVDLEAHRGYLKAMEYALGATIATHSDPPSLRRIWDLMLVEAADTHAKPRWPDLHRCLSAVSSDAHRTDIPDGPRPYQPAPNRSVRICSSLMAASR